MTAKHIHMSASEFDLYVARKLTKKASNARERGIPFDMTFTSMKNILKSTKCYYTGIPLVLPTSGMDSSKLPPNALTIDRIDSSKPYTHGNVVACCYAFNSMKGQVEAGGIDAMRGIVRAFNKAIKRLENMS